MHNSLIIYTHCCYSIWGILLLTKSYSRELRPRRRRTGRCTFQFTRRKC